MDNGWCLFLDLDGTLLDIADAPSAVTVPPDLISTLRDLHSGLDGAIAIVSGRPVSEIDHLLKPLSLPAAGIHGSELRIDGDGDVLENAPPFPRNLLAFLQDYLGGRTGVVIEKKGHGVALHYRKAPEAQPFIAWLVEQIPLQQFGLKAVEGRKVLELMPEHVSKRNAVTALMQRPPFSGRRPVMIGDDAADEPALRTIDLLGGRGLKVAGEHFNPAEADFAGPEHVRRWLKSIVRGGTVNGTPVQTGESPAA